MFGWFRKNWGGKFRIVEKVYGDGQRIDYVIQRKERDSLGDPKWENVDSPMDDHAAALIKTNELYKHHLENSVVRRRVFD